MSMVGHEESWNDLKLRFKQEYAELNKGEKNELLEKLRKKLGRSKEELEKAIRKL